MIHRVLVRLETTGGYVRHYSKKEGRRAQLPPAEQNHCLQCLMRCLIPHDLIILHRQTHANCNSVLSCSCLSGLIKGKKISKISCQVLKLISNQEHRRKVENHFLFTRKKETWAKHVMRITSPAFSIRFLFHRTKGIQLGSTLEKILQSEER